MLFVVLASLEATVLSYFLLGAQLEQLMMDMGLTTCSLSVSLA